MLAKYEYILIPFFLTVISIIAIGDFGIRLATEDYRLAGASHSFKFIYEGLYEGTILSHFNKLNFLLLINIPVLLFEYFKIPVLSSVYLLTIFGNTFFYTIFYYFSKLILKSSKKSFFTLLLFIASGISYNNLSIMGTNGSIQVFPDTNIFAWSIILLSTYFMIRSKFHSAIVVLLFLPFIHLGHFLLFSLFIFTFLALRLLKKKDINEILFLIAYTIFFILIIFIFGQLDVIKSFSHYKDFFFDHLKVSTSHANPLGYSHLFPGVFVSYITVLSFAYLGYLIKFKHESFISNYKHFIFISLFLSLFLFILTIAIPYYELKFLSNIWFLIPARATVYVQIFVFPLASAFLYEIISSNYPKILKYSAIFFMILSSVISSFGLFVINAFFLLYFAFISSYKNIRNQIFLVLIVIFSLIPILYFVYGIYVFETIIFGPFQVYKSFFIQDDNLIFRDSFMIIISARIIIGTILLLIIYSLFKIKNLKLTSNIGLQRFINYKDIMILAMFAFVFANSFQKMSATFFDNDRQDVYNMQLWIGENIESDSIILTDEYVFSFSGIVKNAIIYPSINTFLPFRIINKELEEYQEEVEKITNSDYKNNNVSLLLNVDDIHRHELNVSNLSKDSIYKLSKLHNSKYFITRKNYENLKLLYKNNLYNIYRVL